MPVLVSESVSVSYHHMFVSIIFSSVWVAEWPPFGKELPTRSIYIDVFVIIVIFRCDSLRERLRTRKFFTIDQCF